MSVQWACQKKPEREAVNAGAGAGRGLVLVLMRQSKDHYPPGDEHGIKREGFLMKKHMWLVIALMAALAVALAGGAAMAKPIKVGMVDCYSGPPSTYTNDVRDAFKLATDRFNAEGGVLGSNI